MKTLIALVVVLLSWPALLEAQTVTNPRGLTFTASADHLTIDGYSLDILRADSTVAATADLGKPTPVTNVCTVTLNSQSLAFGNGYSVRVRARAATAVSDWALSVNTFNRVPGAPGRPTLTADVLAATQFSRYGAHPAG